jgi:mRNA interferase MazF
MKIERWEIWLANLEPVLGSEQGKTRPILVLSSTAVNEILPVVNVLPVTSRKPNRRILRWSNRNEQKTIYFQ